MKPETLHDKQMREAQGRTMISLVKENAKLTRALVASLTNEDMEYIMMVMSEHLPPSIDSNTQQHLGWMAFAYNLKRELERRKGWVFFKDKRGARKS